MRGELGDRRKASAAGTGVSSFCGLSPASPKISLGGGDEHARTGSSSSRTAAEQRRSRAGDRCERLGRPLPGGGHERGRGQVVDLARFGARDDIARMRRGSSTSPHQQLDAPAQVLGRAERPLARRRGARARSRDSPSRSSSSARNEPSCPVKPGDQRAGILRHGGSLRAAVAQARGRSGAGVIQLDEPSRDDLWSAHGPCALASLLPGGAVAGEPSDRACQRGGVAGRHERVLLERAPPARRRGWRRRAGRRPSPRRRRGRRSRPSARARARSTPVRAARLARRHRHARRSARWLRQRRGRRRHVLRARRARVRRRRRPA